MTPDFWSLIEALNTALDILNVPTVSMSKTLLKPFVDNEAAVAKKLQAAPLTRISIFPNFSTIFSTVA